MRRLSGSLARPDGDRNSLVALHVSGGVAPRSSRRRRVADPPSNEMVPRHLRYGNHARCRTALQSLPLAGISGVLARRSPPQALAPAQGLRRPHHATVASARIERLVRADQLPGIPGGTASEPGLARGRMATFAKMLPASSTSTVFPIHPSDSASQPNDTAASIPDGSRTPPSQPSRSSTTAGHRTAPHRSRWISAPPGRKSYKFAR